MSFEKELANKLNSFKSFSLINPFSNLNEDDELDNEEDDLNCESVEKDDEETKTNGNKLTDEEKSKRTAELWAFLEDEKPVKRDISNLNSSSNNSSSNNLTSSLNSINNSVKKETTVTKVYDFAGEKVKVEEKVLDKEATNSSANSIVSSNKNQSTSRPAPVKRGLGINNLVANLGKKQKISTLNKSKHDWELYKKDEGIEDDLKNYAAKDKNSYVERQAFLQRADLKQFEHEKSIRDKNRTRNHI